MQAHLQVRGVEDITDFSFYFSSGLSAPSNFGKSPKRPINPNIKAANGTKMTVTDPITVVYPYRNELNILIKLKNWRDNDE